MVLPVLLLACFLAEPISLVRDDVDDGFCGTSIRWQDDLGSQRSAFMVKNGVQDPTGAWGGYVRTFTYEVAGETRVCSGSNPDYPGFGSVVNHFASSSTNSFRQPGGKTSVLFAGAHHVILANTWDYPIGGQNVHIAVNWLFATGRANPVYAITYDLSRVPANSVCADTRAPYGDVDWDGGAGVNVDGVAWGDRYRFTSLQSPVSMQTGWDYTQANTIPFVQAWSDAADAEMGMVQTLDMNAHDAGGSSFYTARGTKNADGPMPQESDWTYQIEQYQIPYTLAAKRIAWGTNYGAVGQTAYPSYGDDRSLVGYPYQSYSVFVVLGEHSKGRVDAQVKAMEAVYQTTMHVRHGGKVAQTGIAGVGRHDWRTLNPEGYDATYATWDAWTDSDTDPVVIKLSVADGYALPQPVIRVHQWHPASRRHITVRMDHRELTANKDYYLSQDAKRSQLWLTLNRTLSRDSHIEISSTN